MRIDPLRGTSSRPVALGTVAALAAGLAAAAPAAASEAPAYVALGDSFTAGPGIPDQRPDSGLCARSDHNYPTLVADALDVTEFKDVSCSAAVTDHMTEPQGLAPPQFDALDANTDLVTVGIGGNDAGFAGIVATCVALAKVDPDGQPCTDHYTRGGTDQLEETFAEVAPEVAAVLRGIHERAPDAEVVLVGYQAILPRDKQDCPAENPNADMVAEKDLPYLSDKERSFARMLAEQAAANDARFVDSLSASVGHETCQPPGTRWIEGILDVRESIPVHPNALGMANVADLVVEELNS